MDHWTSGYVADVGYTYGYYTELNPARIELALLHRGIVPPVIKNACELGFGQGLSTNIHAAASSVNWYGTDFNPSQAAFARELADVSGSGAQLYDDAFADFLSRPDLPEFDFIGIHGIWSWISDSNRQTLIDFVSQKLRVGGVAYISYNTLPGWSSFAPMRHLMTEHASVLGAEGKGIVSRIDEAVDFADKLLATNPMFARANPQVPDRLAKLKDQNRHYLAHEYFNRDWHPMHFATMAEWLEPAKLQFAGSAHYLDHIGPVNLTAEQQQFLETIPDLMFRESTRDFMVNQQFRRDYWVKGARQLSSLEQIERLRQVRLLLATHRPDVSLTVKGSLGDANLTEAVYAPVLDVMQDHAIHTIGDIESAVAEHGVTLPQVIQAAVVLAGSGALHPVPADTEAERSSACADKLNSYLCDKARASNDIAFLASPVTGGGVTLNRFEQLFVAFLKSGLESPADWAARLWDILNAQGQRLVQDGEQLQTPEENIVELTRRAEAFAAERLAALRALKIV